MPRKHYRDCCVPKKDPLWRFCRHRLGALCQHSTKDWHGRPCPLDKLSESWVDRHDELKQLKQRAKEEAEREATDQGPAP